MLRAKARIDYAHVHGALSQIIGSFLPGILHVVLERLQISLKAHGEMDTRRSGGNKVSHGLLESNLANYL